MDLIEIFGQKFDTTNEKDKIQNCKFRRDSGIKFARPAQVIHVEFERETSIVLKIKGVINSTATMRMPWVWSIDLESQEI